MPQLRVGDGVIETAADSKTERPKESISSSGVDWRFALRCATAVALLGGIIQLTAAKFSAAGAVESLWVMTAGAIALVLYHRGRPLREMGAKAGARIGAATGILLAGTVTLAVAATGFVLRYKFNSMSADAELTSVLQQGIDHVRAQQSVPPWVEAMWKSQEFRAWFLILGSTANAMFIVGLCTVVGAVSALVLSPKRRLPQ
jgi:hypothetical protein